MSAQDAPLREPTPSRYWIKLDALLHRNPKVGRLSDAAFRAFIVTLCEAKLCQSEGEWPSRDHYVFAVGPRAARHLDTLLEARLLEAEDGWIRVHDWADWQPKDPTAAERSRRYRDRQRASRDATRGATGRHTEESRGDHQEGRDRAGVAAAGDPAPPVRDTSGTRPPDPATCPKCGDLVDPAHGDLAVVNRRGDTGHRVCPTTAADRQRLSGVVGSIP